MSKMKGRRKNLGSGVLFWYVLVGVLVGFLAALVFSHPVVEKPSVVGDPALHCAYKPNLLDYSNLSFSGFDYCVNRPFVSWVEKGVRYYKFS